MKLMWQLVYLIPGIGGLALLRELIRLMPGEWFYLFQGHCHNTLGIEVNSTGD